MEEGNTQNNGAEQNAQATMPAQTTEGGAQAEQQGESMPLWKLIAIGGYILPFLFFLPLVMDELKGNETSRFHANQQLLVLIIYGIGYVAQMFLLGMLFMGQLWFIVQLIYLFGFIMAIVGAVNAAQDKQKELPLIGHYHFI